MDCSGAYPLDLVLADPKSRRVKVGYVDDRLTEKDFVVGRTVTNGGMEFGRMLEGCMNHQTITVWVRCESAPKSWRIDDACKFVTGYAAHFLQAYEYNISNSTIALGLIRFRLPVMDESMYGQEDSPKTKR